MASLEPVDAGMISMSPRRCCSPTDTDRKSEQRRRPADAELPTATGLPKRDQAG